MIWLFFVTPLPIFYYLRIFEAEKAIKLIARSAVAAGFLVIIKGTLPILLFSFTLVPLGFILAESQKKAESQWRAALKAVIYLAGVWTLFAIILSSAYHTNIYSSILQSIDQLIVMAFESYKTSTTNTPGMSQEFSLAFTELRLLFPRILPGFIAMTVVSIVWLNLLLGDWLLKKKDTTLSNWESYRSWRLPEQLVWGVITAGILLFITSGRLQDFALNTLMVFSLIYFFQGLAILFFLMAKWTIPKSLKFFIFTILVIQAYGMIILALIGFADVWLNFRKKRPEDNNTGTT